VNGAVRLSDGRIAVVNSGSSEIRIFSDAGELIMSIGKDLARVRANSGR
jgi:hypothetical protein